VDGCVSGRRGEVGLAHQRHRLLSRFVGRRTPAPGSHLPPHITTISPLISNAITSTSLGTQGPISPVYSGPRTHSPRRASRGVTAPIRIQRRSRCESCTSERSSLFLLPSKYAGTPLLTHRLALSHPFCTHLRGKYDGPEPERLAVLKLAALMGAPYVDVEFKASPYFFAGGRRSGEQRIPSGLFDRTLAPSGGELVPYLARSALRPPPRPTDASYPRTVCDLPYAFLPSCLRRGPVSPLSHCVVAGLRFLLL
jgi:hypothetical protein